MTIKKRLHRSNIYMFLIPLVTAALLLGGCAGPTAGKDDGRLRVVCTLFPYISAENRAEPI